MVKFSTDIYPQQCEETYKQYFEKFDFPLSTFQKFAIQAIVDGQHSLSCVPTGSGKTLPAIFAIDFFTSKGLKVIYTSPIKALSNQKYDEFTKKFPDITVGLLTGDIKINPEAQVLIMTAEILQNTLYRKNQKNQKNQKNNNNSTNSSLLMFDIDFDNELGCVIQDEIHMINDVDRGHVWESIILMLPLNIQMIMLSATLDKPQAFAYWIENRGTKSNKNENSKEVYLATSNFRPVPLTHYSFITTTQGIFKAIKKDEVLEKEIKGTINKMHVIQSSTGVFNEINYHKVKKMLTLFEQKQIYIKRSYVLNQLCKYMVENDMLPAVCFILSRKQIQIAAKEITVPLLEDDSKVAYNVRRECEQILRSKLANFQEYLELPEYIELVSLLEKGIAIHHSGIMPILREIVEILFEKGYIKLLFATETFSVGLNMPIKTTIFTGVKKHDGIEHRMLYSHEFIQASGRAGRRGIDTVGHVVHLNNLFRDVELSEYRIMMQGKPQTLVSKFKISYNLILNLIGTEEKEKVVDIVSFCKRSMIQDNLMIQMSKVYGKINSLETEIENIEKIMKYIRTPVDVVEQYLVAIEGRKTAVNKKRKELDREIQNIQDNYKFIDADKLTVMKYDEKMMELTNLRQDYYQLENYVKNNVSMVIALLENESFIKKISTEETGNEKYELTSLGFIATHIREIHCLTFAKLLETISFDILTPEQLVCIFSCFTNITVSDEFISYNLPSNDTVLKNIIEEIYKKNQYYQDFEIKKHINTGIDYNIHYDLIEYVLMWCKCETSEQCKLILQKLEYEKGIFLGEFVKAILKINNISSELEKIAESVGNIALLSKLKEIPKMTLKFIATNQSLYV